MWNLVSGSFGTREFNNCVDMVVDTWIELLVGEDARFKKSLERIMPGVIRARRT